MPRDPDGVEPDGPESHAVGKDLFVHTLLIEELGRRGMQRLSLMQLRMVLQFGGCKPQLVHCAAASLFDDVQDMLFPSHDAPAGQCSLFAAAATHTLHEQWSRRSLRPVQCKADALAIAEGDTEGDYLVALMPRVLFTHKMEALLSQVLRGNFATPEPLRRLSIVTTVVERHVPLVVFCGGTSGCGKSTLANLLASLLGIRTIVSTDSVRELLRGQSNPDECPELFASTYEAFRQFPAMSKSPLAPFHGPFPASLAMASVPRAEGDPSTPIVQRIVTAYEKQSQHVLAVLDRMIDIFIRRNESVVIEGVHLLAPYMLRKAADLAYNGVPCVPVLFQIVNEAKHKERFAIRAKSMTMLPRGNKYVENFAAIRTIQAHLVGLAGNTDVLIVNNTNVDKSVNTIHECIISCLDNFSTSTKSKSGTFMPTAVSRGRPKIKGKDLLEKILARREAKRTQERVRSAEARPMVLTKATAGDVHTENTIGVPTVVLGPVGTRSQSAGLPSRAFHGGPQAVDEDDHGSLIGS